jgi:hypothetical protein
MTTPSELAGKACEGQSLQQLPFTKLTTKYNDFLSGLKLNQCVIDKQSGSGSSSPDGTDVDANGGGAIGSIVSLVSSEFFSLMGLFGGGSPPPPPPTYNWSRVSGCSGVNALLQTYNNAVQDVKCIITQDTTNMTITVSEGNKVVINVGGNFLSDCPINQTISGTVNLYSQISNTSSDVIKSTLNNHIQNFTNQLKDMYNGQPQYNKKGEGTQNVNQILQSSTQNDIDNQVDDRIETFNKSVFANQTYTLNVGGNLTLFAGSGMCGSLTQDIQLDIISSSIVQGVFTSALKGVDMSSLLPPLPFTIPPPVKKHGNAVGINILILIIIIIAIYWFFVIRKK